ncbi:hypothetical protein [Clostridium sp. C8-1-8]|uniref:hypothetical protein n=1 Tax=Clostridium sp. C8-1-8 TaxID=2698831 RepID=UPI0013716A9C|nr:hypothetical protein [Clostridium sp. C8-1-8]
MEMDFIKKSRFSGAGYLLCVISALLISIDNDYTNLKNGIILIILFFLQLLLILANIVSINKKRRKYNVKVIFLQRMELALRFIVFYIINTNLNRFGIHIYLQGKLIIILCSFIVSCIIIMLQHKTGMNANTSISTETGATNSPEISSGSNSKDLSHISLIGFLLYIYSVTMINHEIKTVTLGIKLLAFGGALWFIAERLKKYHSKLEKNKLSLIIAALAIGFLSNLIVATIVSIYNINTSDFNGIKDFMFIFSMICALPLLKEYFR